MQKLGFVFFFSIISLVINGQTLLQPQSKSQDTTAVKFQDSLVATPNTSKSKKNILNKLDPNNPDKTKTKIQDYLIISHKNDTTYVDTALTIKKDYKFNYLRKDNFGLMPFSNLGQTYNSLTYNFENSNVMPSFGARARHFNYMEIEDINYYRVPTPFTELLFRSAFEQGQLADSFFTVNTSPQFNFSIAYKGVRSLGKYQHLLTSTGNFRFTTNYQTKSKRYHFKGHVVTQDLLNQENGGLQDQQIPNFESGAPEFIDRSILEVNFENAQNTLVGKRFHLDHDYTIIRVKDSLSKNKLSLGHIMSFEDKYYQYNQTRAETSFFGAAFKTTNLVDRATIENFHNQLQLNFSNTILGDLRFHLGSDNYNYGYNKVVVLDGETITNRLKGTIYSAGGQYHKKYKSIELYGELGLNISGDFEGNYIKGDATFNITHDILAKATINHSSKAPNYNTLLYQSDYVNYNWQNDFNNIETQQIAFQLQSKKHATLSVDYTTINNYTYFTRDATGLTQDDFIPVKPFQNNNTINYLRVKLENEIRYKKFALNNTVLYQNVQDDNNVLNVPELTTRNTLYYASHLFKKALYLQTGITLNYFTSYNLNAYDPLLAEFYVQNDQEFGDFPRLDFFINAKVRQTRIYLKAEHFNSSFTGFNFYSAPNNPYRDFTVRFGIVWNFFL